MSKETSIAVVSYMLACEEIAKTSKDNTVVYKPFISRTVSSLPATGIFSVLVAILVNSPQELEKCRLKLLDPHNKPVWTADLMERFFDGDSLTDIKKRIDTGFAIELGITPVEDEDDPIVLEEEGTYIVILEVNGVVKGRTFFEVQLGE